MDWQTVIAAAIVLATLVFFVFRMLRPKKGCGGGCDCGKKPR
jgi:hypothetical protein